jgi:hypothetical protein
MRPITTPEVIDMMTDEQRKCQARDKRRWFARREEQESRLERPEGIAIGGGGFL